MCGGERELSIGVLILTFNEEANLPAALESLKGWVERVVVVDSYSTDRTIEIALAYGCDVLQNSWVSHARQLNWGLEHGAFRTNWIMRLDADERVTPRLRDARIGSLPGVSEEVCGVYVRRQVHFMGRWIKHGGYYPTWLLRVWRNGAASCEVRWMDEHMRLERGRSIALRRDIIDENTQSLTWWIEKHNRYAIREAIDLLHLRKGVLSGRSIPGRFWGQQSERHRWMKEHIYAVTPPFWRAFAYFLYRYVLRAGFLDGVPGLIWHFLQGCWYRFLVDAKIHEITRRSRARDIPLEAAIRELYGIDA